MKYIKSFNTTAEMEEYIAQAENSYYVLSDNSKEGYDGIVYLRPIYPEYEHDYLTFTAQEANATVKYNATTNTTAEYSLDGGNSWTDAVGVTVTLANVGDSVKYRGVISGNISNNVNSRFTMSGKIAASGSIMSMYNENPDDTEITYNNSFARMFQNCTSLVNAPIDLPATKISYSCYGDMFRGCTSLVSGPLVLPATTLQAVSYQTMFAFCSSLTNAPEIMALSLASNAMHYMFSGCTSLTSVTHHITDWRTYNAENWLENGSATGTVYCPSASTIPSNNLSGIPTGWSRVDID